MNIVATKVELIKGILNTNDKEIINHFMAILTTRNNDWWETLPDEIKESVTEALKEAERGETISHHQAMKKYSKWLKK